MNFTFNKGRRLLCLTTLFTPLTSPSRLFAAEKPALKLSQIYSKELRIEDYLVSEKYDGIRVYWTGHSFLTRAGNIILPPEWWSGNLSNIALDGELWIERGAFSELNGTLKRSRVGFEQWRRIKFLVFDLPTNREAFVQRYGLLVSLMEHTSSPNIQHVEQRTYVTHYELMERLDSVIAAGGEGLMLQHKNAHYNAGRHAGLYKLKRWQDAEAVVVGSTSGRGKYIGVMGALIVETPEGIKFRLGSGFSDAERANPPIIGAIVTYKYSGKSNKGVPRFASFLRIHD